MERERQRASWKTERKHSPLLKDNDFYTASWLKCLSYAVSVHEKIKPIKQKHKMNWRCNWRRLELQHPCWSRRTSTTAWLLPRSEQRTTVTAEKWPALTCDCCWADSGLLKALDMMRLISTPVLFFTHMERSHWTLWSGSVGFNHASSSSHTWRGGGGRMNSGRKWPKDQASRTCGNGLGHLQ